MYTFIILHISRTGKALAFPKLQTMIVNLIMHSGTTWTNFEQTMFLLNQSEYLPDNLVPGSSASNINEKIKKINKKLFFLQNYESLPSSLSLILVSLSFLTFFVFFFSGEAFLLFLKFISALMAMGPVVSTSAASSLPVS